MFSFPGSAARSRRSFIGNSRFEMLEERIALSGAPPKVMDVGLGSTQWTPAFVAYLNTQGVGDGGYSIPVGSSNQSIALPWNNLDQIRITFSEDVYVDAADLSVTGKNVVSYAFSDFYYDPQSRVAVWTLATPIQKDRLMLDLDGDGIDPVRNLEDSVLDGNWTNNSFEFASGDDIEGGDFEFTFNVLPADANASGQVTTADYLAVKSLNGKSTSSGGYLAKYDLDGSGTINSTDWQYVLGKVGNSLPTGAPYGAAGDAPTARTVTGVSLSNPAVDAAISLWDYFGDYEDGASGLTYSIQSNSNPELFDALSIDQETGELVLSGANGVSGRATVTVGATDSNGVTTSNTIAVDVGYQNQAPFLQLDMLVETNPNQWLISGFVSDDSDVTDLIIEFSGEFTARCAVYPDGSFEFTIELDQITSGSVTASTTDRHGDVSNAVTRYF